MRVAILSAREGWHTRELCRALSAHGDEGRVVPYESLVARLGTASKARRDSRSSLLPPPSSLLLGDGEPLDAADAVLARIIPNGSLEQIIFRVDALHWLEDLGVRVMNSPRTIERTVDKFYTSALLEQAGLETPETIVCERADEAMTAFRSFGDVVVKPLFGSMGLGMVRVTEEEIAWRVFRALDAVRAVYYVQRAIAHDGLDIRAFVVGERVIGAIERTAVGWRTNMARGARAREITLPAELAEMAIRATRAVDADYAGVDLLPGRDGTVYVLEVNGIPGWRGLQEATSLDVAGAIVEHLGAIHATR